VAESQPPHHLADADRRQVGRRVVDPRPVGGIERDPLGADEGLALADLRRVLLDKLERLGTDAPGRPLAQQELAVSLGDATTLADVPLGWA
jgi:hypothetical protein